MLESQSQSQMEGILVLHGSPSGACAPHCVTHCGLLSSGAQRHRGIQTAIATATQQQHWRFWRKSALRTGTGELKRFLRNLPERRRYVSLYVSATTQHKLSPLVAVAALITNNYSIPCRQSSWTHRLVSQTRLPNHPLSQP